MKKFLILISVVIIIAIIITVIVFIYKIIRFDKAWKSGVGKDFTIEIKQDEHAYYQYLSSGNFTLWFADEREKMIQYMKENNLKILPGLYNMNQATTFEEALDIFEFEKIN